MVLVVFIMTVSANVLVFLWMVAEVGLSLFVPVAQAVLSSAASWRRSRRTFDRDDDDHRADRQDG